VAAAAAAGVAALIVATGGFTLKFGAHEITGEHPINPLVAAVIAFAAAAVLARPRVDATLFDDVRALLARWPVTALFILGAGLRFWYWALARPLWLDEQMIAINIRDRGFADLTGALWLGQSAPLGWLWSERLVVAALGTSETALRLVPFALGVATLAAAWWIGRRWLTLAGAATLMGLFAIGRWVFHYALELKHYSADTLFGLLLPALVVWAIEGRDGVERRRRIAAWWLAAIVGAWVSVAGVLVAPACALVLVVAAWRRDGVRGTAVVVACGTAWLASFALLYLWSLRFSMNNAFLHTVWEPAMAPAAADLAGRFRWLAAQAAPIAEKPAGTSFALACWAAAIYGWSVARPRLVGVTFALVVVSAAVLALLRVVPLFERLSLWMLPAVYAGLAFAMDDAWRRWRRPRIGHTAARTAVATMAAAAVALVAVDAARQSWMDIPAGHPAGSNHSLDDRGAMQWIASRVRPGDVILGSKLATPAIWWYGGALLSSPNEGRALGPAPIVELTYHQLPCDATRLPDFLSQYSRALVFFGFRFDDLPKDFETLALHTLSQSGVVVDEQRFDGVSRTALVELGLRDAGGLVFLPGADTPRGCVGVRAASRW
jgi:hypothetical protein